MGLLATLLLFTIALLGSVWNGTLKLHYHKFGYFGVEFTISSTSIQQANELRRGNRDAIKKTRLGMDDACL